MKTRNIYQTKPIICYCIYQQSKASVLTNTKSILQNNKYLINPSLKQEQQKQIINTIQQHYHTRTSSLQFYQYYILKLKQKNSQIPHYNNINPIVETMSQKYRQRILTNSGISTKKVQSQYAKRIMMKMGWTQGKGLGKRQTGIIDCVQIKRRQQRQGLGINSNHKQIFNWKDQWWNQAYNNSIQKLNIITNKNKNKIIQHEDSDNEDSSSSEIGNKLKTKTIKKNKNQK